MASFLLVVLVLLIDVALLNSNCLAREMITSEESCEASDQDTCVNGQIDDSGDDDVEDNECQDGHKKMF